jgi:hypothetical protein
MDVSLSMINLSRPDPAALVQVRDQAGPDGRPALPETPEAPYARPDARRGPGFAEAALSLTQVGLVGRAMIDAASPPAPSVRSGAAPGEPRRVERVLAPWGVPMLPSEAARAAREAAEAERVAALRGDGQESGRSKAGDLGGTFLPVAAQGDDPSPRAASPALPDPGSLPGAQGRARTSEEAILSARPAAELSRAVAAREVIAGGWAPRADGGPAGEPPPPFARPSR